MNILKTISLVLVISAAFFTIVSSTKDNHHFEIFKKKVNAMKEQAREDSALFFENTPSKDGWTTKSTKESIGACVDGFVESIELKMTYFYLNHGEEKARKFRKLFNFISGTPEESCTCVVKTLSRIVTLDNFIENSTPFGLTEELETKYNDSNGPNCVLGKKFFSKNEEEILKNQKIIEGLFRLYYEPVTLTTYTKE